jgi:ornithine carbamoyltransferase
MMREHARRTLHEITYAFLGDGRSTCAVAPGHGAITGADVRIVAPPTLQPPNDVIALAQARAAESGARVTVTDDARRRRGRPGLRHDRRVGLNGRAQGRLGRSRPAAASFQVNADLLSATGNPAVKFMHCLPAFHGLATADGRAVAEATGMTGGLEVTYEVFRSPASIVFNQAENHLHTIKAILVATPG